MDRVEIARMLAAADKALKSETLTGFAIVYLEKDGSTSIHVEAAPQRMTGSQHSGFALLGALSCALQLATLYETERWK